MPAACLTTLTAVSSDHPMKALGGAATRHASSRTAVRGTAGRTRPAGATMKAEPHVAHSSRRANRVRILVGTCLRNLPGNLCADHRVS
eukprot:2776866-Prymnesium_polylepis.2